MKRSALLLALATAGCTKPAVRQSADAVPVRSAGVAEQPAEPAEATVVQGDRSVSNRSRQIETQDFAVSRSSSGWSVGVKREAESARLQDDQATSERGSAGDAQEDDTLLGSAFAGGGGSRAPAQEPGATEIETKFDPPGGTNESPGNVARVPADDASQDEADTGASLTTVSAEANTSDCAPGEVPEGYDAAGDDDTGLCVPQKLVETCRQLGQLPVIVLDTGMDCFVPQAFTREGDDALAEGGSIELPSCAPDAAIVLLPEVEGEIAASFDCRHIAQLDETTASALSQQACGEQVAVVHVASDSSTEETIRGDVSCF